MVQNNVELFLRESNAIEDVWDDDSLQQAIYAWEYLISEPELSRGVVLKTHKILMLHQPLRPDERGYFRKCDVQVGGQVKLSWLSIQYALDQWLYRIKQTWDFPYEKKDLEQLIQSLHVQYEDIHPFVDGNGRTGRMFLNWHRVKKDLPILVIKESEKFAYYDWFK